MALEALLASLGLGVASNAIYDFVKRSVALGSTSLNALAGGLRSEYPEMSVENAQVVAKTAVDFLASNGDIKIVGTSIYAPDSVSMGSENRGTFSFGDGSTSSTDSTRIVAGKGARIVTKGKASVKQNPDGSISFHV